MLQPSSHVTPVPLSPLDLETLERPLVINFSPPPSRRRRRVPVVLRGEDARRGALPDVGDVVVVADVHDGEHVAERAARGVPPAAVNRVGAADEGLLADGAGNAALLQELERARVERHGATKLFLALQRSLICSLSSTLQLFNCFLFSLSVPPPSPLPRISDMWGTCG